MGMEELRSHDPQNSVLTALAEVSYSKCCRSYIPRYLGLHKLKLYICIQDDYSQFGMTGVGPYQAAMKTSTVVVPELPTLSNDETELLQTLTNSVSEPTPEDTWRSKYIVVHTFFLS